MEVIQSLNLALWFLLELCVLVAVGYWGFHTGTGPVMKVVLGIGAPLLVAIVWVTFVAPGAWMPVSDPWHLLLELLIFGLAATGLAATGTTQQELGLIRVGDCDDNNVVNSNDLVIFRNSFNKALGSPGYGDRADFTCGDVVNITDFALFRSNFGVDGSPPIGP